MSDYTEPTELRSSAYPTALEYRKTRFGMTNEWWVLLVVAVTILFVLRLYWPFLLLIGACIVVLGVLVTRYDPHALKIYLQYSVQHDRYEPGFFYAQKRFKRPEGMGREIVG